MQGDDFCTFGRLFYLHNSNPFTETAFLYNEWTGRYTSSFLIALPGSVSRIVPFDILTVYRLFVFAYLLSVFAAFYAFSRILTDNTGLRLLLSLLVTDLCLLLMPDKAMGIYWVTGSAVYCIAISAFLLLAVRIHDEYTTRLEARWPTASTMLLLFAVIGFNELLAISAGMLLGLYTLAHGRHGWNRKAVLLMAAWAVFMAVTVLAPGNFFRDGGLTTERHKIGPATDMLIAALRHYWSSAMRPTVPALLLALASGVLIGMGARKHLKLEAWRAWGPMAACLLLSFPIQLFIYSFLAGEPAPGRVIDQSGSLLWLGVILLSLAVGWHLPVARHGQGWPAAAAPYAVLAAGLAQLLHPEFLSLNQDLRSFAPGYGIEQTARIQAINQALAAGQKTLSVNQFTLEPARWLYIGDITPDPKYWLNACVATYYRLEQISLKPAGQ
ncbi:hypothetical protein JHL17_01290 [Azospirillum sp. YIM B02556]|uniref:Glycosyltransferase RgtA/B/C/D-like domain-containing protein n=1 Tax=Azospirillum endophyticum TaxID=2800326 RepID=A0ABS1EXY5_9PROT|nr:hypothetical protein [Azospirillum endophyticum]